ncbi:MAG: glycosyltransferase [Candidatus Pacebacteria bacterium]|nr:glycosyltransferase [Candidatus Paceibacterota bacterium]
MKILYFITKSNWGGAQKYVFDLATYFKNRGENISVAFGGNGILSEKLKKENIHTIFIKNLIRNVGILKEIKSFREIFKILIREKPEIIHLNSSKISIYAAILGRLTGVRKIIFTAHGFPFREERSYLQILFIKFFTWLTIFLSHKTICVSEKDFEDVKDWFFIKNKLIIIHNGLKKEEESIEIEDIQNKEKNLVKIVSIAELHKNKGLEYGIKTIVLLKERIQNFKYFIFSFGGDEEVNLIKLIKDLNLENFIEIKILEENEKVNLKEFDIYFLPSIKEGLPYVLLEAGINSLAIVASDTGGVKEVVENYKNGFLISPKDVNAFDLALEKLILDYNLRKNFGNELKDKVLKNFLFEEMIKKVEAVYK